MLVGIPNLAIGNFASVLRMVQKVGGAARLLRAPDEIRNADRIILAGVGAFDRGMASLREGGWIDALSDAALQRGIPVLGICLGMQLMCTGSEEGQLPGLGWIAADVRRLVPGGDGQVKVPHMGWNTVHVYKPNPLIAIDGGESRFYFVHSYHAVCQRGDDVLATAHHGCEFTAAVSHDNIYGVQFHPEKSHRFGKTLITKFLEL